MQGLTLTKIFHLPTGLVVLEMYYSLNGHPSGPSFWRQFFHSHPLSTHIWYQNVQLTFRASVQADFHWAGLQMKAQFKPQNPYIEVVAKKGFPMVFRRMRTRQVQWRNWNGGV